MSSSGKKLPCFPCPHASACCSFGASVTEGEKEQILRHHGADKLVYDEEEQGFRTKVVDGACAFLKENACGLHDESYYPEVCRRFPWEYEHDVTICPELARTPTVEELFPDLPELSPRARHLLQAQLDEVLGPEKKEKK